jgi:hypothetical protein
MGDNITQATQRLRGSQRDEEPVTLPGLLDKENLFLNDGAINLILNDIDFFVSLSRDNRAVQRVFLYPYVLHGHDDDAVWNKVGQALGNLQALEQLRISNRKFADDYDCDVVLVPDWERLARILSHMRQIFAVNPHDNYEYNNDCDSWTVGEAQGLARAIRGHPTITRFDCDMIFPHESMDSLYSAWATLPALKSVSLTSPQEDESTVANPESLTKFLRVSPLRSVYFSRFHFTSALCQATVNALVEGTAITNLDFRNCSFSTVECAAMMANGLGRNTSVISIVVSFEVDGRLSEALATALPLNSMLQQLSFGSGTYSSGAHIDWSPTFLALGRNTGLKFLKVNVRDSMEESLCTAMQNGLGTNTTLETLELKLAHLCDDTADLWCRTFSFLRTNKTLKSLAVHVHRDVTESCMSAFLIGIVSMLQENATLEILYVQNDRNVIEAEAYFPLVTMLQHNTTLKRLQHSYNGRLSLTDDEDKRMAKSLQKNYALESLPNIVSLGDVDAILRLNAAGRRYLIEDGFSVSKGVEVLSRVDDNMNCVLLHLLENPNLCDRSAVEVASDDTEEGSISANLANHNGKREQGQALEEAKESRIRRT